MVSPLVSPLAYSFQNVQCSIVGPGGVCYLGYGAGVAEGGITIEMANDKNNMMIGADGNYLHSVAAGQGGRVTVRLMKNAFANNILQVMYDLQRGATPLWGLNTIITTDILRGDVITCIGSAFKRVPSNTWAQNANILEWTFDVGQVESVFGLGDVAVFGV